MPANPDLVGLIDAMIAHAVEDLADPFGYLNPVLRAYGLTLNTDPSQEDEGERIGLKFGDPDPSGGVSIHFDGMASDPAYFLMPLIARIDYLIVMKCIWKDSPTGSLQSTSGKYRRFLTSFTAALASLFGPAALGAPTGFWAIGDGGVLIENLPWIDPAVESEARGQVRLQGEVGFTCFTTYSNP